MGRWLHQSFRHSLRRLCNTEAYAEAERGFLPRGHRPKCRCVMRFVASSFLVLFCVTLAVGQTSKPKCTLPEETGSEVERLEGRVKLIRTFKVSFRMDDEKRLVRGRSELDYEESFDRKGNITGFSSRNYLPLDPADRIVSEYDCDEANRTKEIRYRRVKDSFYKKTVYRYDDHGRKAERADYFADGTLDRNEQYRYDDKGNLIEEISKQQAHPQHFNPPRTDVYVTTKRTFAYDE